MHMSYQSVRDVDMHAGGMLASWMRLKYPHILDGAIAGSAPIWSYLGEHPVHSPHKPCVAPVAPEQKTISSPDSHSPYAWSAPASMSHSA